MSAAALETATAESRDMLGMFSSVGGGLGGVGNTVSTAITILGVLRRLMGRGKKEG